MPPCNPLLSLSLITVGWSPSPLERERTPPIYSSSGGRSGERRAARRPDCVLYYNRTTSECFLFSLFRRLVLGMSGSGRSRYESSIIPARFLITLGHLVATLLVFSVRDACIAAGLGVGVEEGWTAANAEVRVPFVVLHICFSDSLIHPVQHLNDCPEDYFSPRSGADVLHTGLHIFIFRIFLIYSRGMMALVVHASL